MKVCLFVWIYDWLQYVEFVGLILLIIVVVWLLCLIGCWLICCFGEYYMLLLEMVMGVCWVIGFVVYFVVLFIVLNIFGVLVIVLWMVFIGFVVVGVVVFFVVWSVLFNIFCILLIFIIWLFCLYDYIEVLENGEKLGLKGWVIDVNLIYIMLQEIDGGYEGMVLQVFNNMFFQCMVCCWCDLVQVFGGIQGDG